VKRYRAVLDVAELPTIVFGRRAITWWGTIAFMAIEGATMVIAMVSWLYLRKNQYQWPPPPTRLPDLLLPTINVAFLTISNIVALRLQKRARVMDKQATKVLILVLSVVGVIAVGMRVFDFRELNTHWDSNAYSSAAWLAVGFHTSLLFLSMIENWVFTVLFWFGPVEGKHFPDVDDTCIYWYFLTLSWIPLYVLLYWGPRLL